MKMQTLALFGMVATAIGGVAYVFIYPFLSGERKVEQRFASVARPEPVARKVGRTQQKSRREQVVHFSTFGSSRRLRTLAGSPPETAR